MIDSNKSSFSKILAILSVIGVTGGGGVLYIVNQSDNKKVERPKIEENSEDLVLEENEAQLPSFLEDKEGENFVMDDSFFAHKRNEDEEDEEIITEEPKEPKPENKNKGKFSSSSENIKDLSDYMAFDNPKIPEKKIESLKRGSESTQPKPEILPPLPNQPEVFKNNDFSSNNTKGFNRFIAQEIVKKDEEKLAEFLMDEENPTNIASQPYELSRVVTTDTFIPAVMYTAVNSEIPSKTVLAIVESDVAGFHGRNILIPKGSKIEGVYEQLQSKTSRRMQISWFKITRPDGVIIKLQDAESGDQAGAGGLSGYLDQRLKDRYGAAMLLSLINAGAQMSVNSNNVNQLAAVESFSRESATLTAQIIRENINTMPVIMIRQGTRFNIRPLQNIYFPELKSGDKVVEASLMKQ